MVKRDLQRTYFPSDEKDDQEKELYLKELGTSVHQYIKKGIKNSQLDDLLKLQSEFQEKYEERFDIQKIIDLISKTSKSEILELGIVKVEDRTLSNKQRLEQKEYSYIVEKAYERVINTTVEAIRENMQNILKDAAYLSHINMLYELYEKEEKLRREEKEFVETSEKYQRMADITRELGKRKRIELEELEQQVNISKEDLNELLKSNCKYFNTRSGNNSIQISLSTVGRNYNNYISNVQNVYSNDAMNQLIYKNCNNLMESLESSYGSGIEFEIKLEGLNPDKERAIRHKYNKTIQEIIASNEDVYLKRDIIMKKASVNKNNEKNRLGQNKFIIPNDWDDEEIF